MEELNNLNKEEKELVLKKLISERRKEIVILVAQKRLYIKNDDFENISLVRKKIKQKKDEINFLQNLKTTGSLQNKKTTKIKKENEGKLLLTREEIDILEKYINNDQLKKLTDFDNIEVSLLEHLLKLKQSYIADKKTINIKIKNIRKSIKLLTSFGNDEDIELNKMLNQNLILKKAISKILKYLDKLIRIEFKKKNSLTKKEKRLVETLFADKIGLKEDQKIEDYTIQELYSVYYELIFKDRDISEITDLLEKKPELYLLENKNKLFYELILDKYTNILLNKNYIGTSLKSKKNLEELEYYKKLIIKYLVYSFENNKPVICDLTIGKIERIITLFNKNDIYLEKSHEILSQIKYFQEIIHLGSTKNNDYVREIKDEYIFSIDTEATKIKEDALSIEKKDNNYYLNFYIPDLISFIPKDSILEKKALERYKSKSYAFPLDIIKFFKFNQGRKKRVIGYHFIFDENGSLKNLKIEKNLIKLHNSYSFNQFDKLFNTDINAEYLTELYELLSSKKIKDMNHYSNAILSFLIQYSGMILAKYLGSKNTKCFYKNISNGEVHYSYNDNDYIEFTSPLRSYLSFYNQRVIFEQNIKDIDKQCYTINQKVKEKEKKYEK